jgi:hypothetical protein
MRKTDVKKNCERAQKAYTSSNIIREWMDINGLGEEVITEDAFIKAYYRFRKYETELKMANF